MNGTGKVILATSALGGIVGVSYLIVRSRRGPDADETTAEKADRPDRGKGDLEPLPGTITPLAEPRHPSLHKRINRSHRKNDIVQEPATELLKQARRYDPEVTMDELTGARLAASEHASGTFTELACIVDAELNRAERRGISLFEHLTDNGVFGKQDRKRRASTRRDPHMRHLLAARAVLSGKARGVSQGATQFFDPETMDKMNRDYKTWLQSDRKGEKPRAVSCDALSVLEAWSFDYGRDPRTKNRCPPNRSRRGKHTLAWVGPIDGVNPLQLMLMKPMKPDPEHQRRYEEARDVLRRGLKKQG